MAAAPAPPPRPHQVGHIFWVEQRVQELRSQVDSRLGSWNSGGFGGRQGGRLLFVIVIFHQGWLCVRKTVFIPDTKTLRHPCTHTRLGRLEASGTHPS